MTQAGDAAVIMGQLNEEAIEELEVDDNNNQAIPATKEMNESSQN